MALVRRIIVGVLATLLAWTAAPSLGQQGRGTVSSPTAVRIDGLDVEEVSQLSIGTQLNFSLFGTPDSLATLQIDGARRGLLLHESDKGVYEGTYTIDEQDRIPSDGQVVATLRRGAEVAKSVLEEPMVLSPPTPVERNPSTRRSSVGAGLEPAIPSAYGRAVPAAPVASACADCAVVESVRAVESGTSRGIGGAIAGGLLGAILGNQFGHGDLRGFARFIGAVGGVLTGREIERAGSRRIRYDVVLRLPNGASQIHSYDIPPPVKVGDTIRMPAVTYSRAPSFVSPF